MGRGRPGTGRTTSPWLPPVSTARTSTTPSSRRQPFLSSIAWGGAAGDLLIDRPGRLEGLAFERAFERLAVERQGGGLGIVPEPEQVLLDRRHADPALGNPGGEGVGQVLDFGVV